MNGGGRAARCEFGGTSWKVASAGPRVARKVAGLRMPSSVGGRHPRSLARRPAWEETGLGVRFGSREAVASLEPLCWLRN